MDKNQTLEKMRLAFIEVTKKRGGKYVSYTPGDHEKNKHGSIWHAYNLAYIALCNQVHSGIAPTDHWEELDPLCRAGRHQKEAIEILEEAGLREVKP
jgi:hypothetical protein